MSRDWKEELVCLEVGTSGFPSSVGPLNNLGGREGGSPQYPVLKIEMQRRRG